MSPLVALIMVPVTTALLAGFGLETAQFMVAGLQQTASVAAMFVFAILYFGVMTDAGMLDPVVDRILRAVGTNPTRSSSARHCWRCWCTSMGRAP